MHHNNFGNVYTREIYAIPIPTGFIPILIPIPIMSRMAIPMGFPTPMHTSTLPTAHGGRSVGLFPAVSKGRGN